ncbi:MAG: YicC/YloC family endoribonuclease [Marivibrio sp.]|uniref:YicC/YloC family endoribonuclease n=1 Tax=Marivibrio sp. TaxID=2039719 RepID=UPI0032EE7BBA
MSLASMTGFARVSGEDDRAQWVWEARSVNGKGLDVRVRLPSGWDRLDPIARAATPKRFKRGNVSLTLELRTRQAAGRLAVNEALLQTLIARCEAAGESPRLDRLLQVRGVVEPAEEAASEALEADARAEALAAALEEALDALAAARAEEGARIRTVIEGQLAEIERLVEAAAACADAQPAAIRERLARQIEDLTDGRGGLEPERIAQEAAALAVKADVREELDRLRGHIEAARALIAEGAAVGRRFDFLCQEFNREANTLASKSSALALTRIGLDLKAVIDQLREQVQNVE